MRRWSAIVVGVVAAACSHGPPPDFAPDPGLVAQIREIRMVTNTRACPGETFGATYTAVLNDGALVSFETRYDRKHPPRLHVTFLYRTSDEATPLEGGAWAADPDALTSAVTGFRLTASLKAKPSVTTTTALTPDYTCLPHTFGFRGAEAGATGPQVTVRLGILRSPGPAVLRVRGRQRGAALRLADHRGPGGSRGARDGRRTRQTGRARSGRMPRRHRWSGGQRRKRRQWGLRWARRSDHDHRPGGRAVPRWARGRADPGWRGGAGRRGRHARHRWCGGGIEQSQQ